MKHAAEVFSATVTGGRPIYCREQTTPTGTYHWANPKGDNPPTLTKITQTRWHEAEWSLFNGERKRVIRGEHVTVWKHGWHHIKGARKVKK